MGQGIGERVSIISGALGATVDVEAENRTGAVAGSHRETEKFRGNQGAINTLVKAYFPPNAGIGVASPDNGNRPGRQVCQGGKIIETVSGWHESFSVIVGYIILC